MFSKASLFVVASLFSMAVAAEQKPQVAAPAPLVKDQEAASMKIALQSPVVMGALRTIQLFERQYQKVFQRPVSAAFAGVAASVNAQGGVDVGAYHFTSPRLLQRDEYVCGASVRGQNMLAIPGEAREVESASIEADQAEEQAATNEFALAFGLGAELSVATGGACRHRGQALEWDVTMPRKKHMLTDYRRALIDAILFFQEKLGSVEGLSVVRIWSADALMGVRLEGTVRKQARKLHLMCQQSKDLSRWECRPISTEIGRPLPH